jgi:hypothetical protein
MASCEPATFELRIVHDHLYKMSSLFEGLKGVAGASLLQEEFLRLTSRLPPVIYGERSEEKLLFVRVYVLLKDRKSVAELHSLTLAAEDVNATMGISRPLFQRGWLDPWKDGSLRKWADMFEERVARPDFP